VTNPQNAAGPASGNSQIIGSQILSQRQLQGIQGQTSFYSSQQPEQIQQSNLPQTGFYQKQHSAYNSLQAPIGQIAGTNQYALQGFSTTSSGLHNLSQLHSQGPPANPVSLASQSTLNKSAPPFKPASMQHSSNIQQTQHHNTSQIRTPPHSSSLSNQQTFLNMQGSSVSGNKIQQIQQAQSLGLTAQQLQCNQYQTASQCNNSYSKPFNHKQTPQHSQFFSNPQVSQQTHLSQQLQSSQQQNQFPSKLNNQYMNTNIQNAGTLMPAHVFMGIRPTTPQNTNNRFNATPIQRSSVQNVVVTRQQRPQTLHSPQNIIPHSGSQQFVNKNIAGSQVVETSEFHAQQAKLRAEVLQHTQSFLNPQSGKNMNPNISMRPTGLIKEDKMITADVNPLQKVLVNESEIATVLISE